MLLELMCIQGVRFLLFDHSMLKPIRDYFWKKNRPRVKKFLSCTFCQGFWCGFIMHFDYTIRDWRILILYAFSSAFISYSWSLWAYTKVQACEKFSEELRRPKL